MSLCAATYLSTLFLVQIIRVFTNILLYNAGPKDMGNDSNWHHSFDILASCLHRQQYTRSRAIAAVFSVVMERSSGLCDDTKNGCNGN